jgi:hypothetical protein
MTDEVKTFVEGMWKNRNQDWMERALNQLDNYKAQYGCKFCAEHDPVTLDIHSSDPDIAVGVMNILGKVGFSEVIRELKKCDIICAKCWRKICE